MTNQVPQKQTWMAPKLTAFGDVSGLTGSPGSFTKQFGGSDSIVFTIPPTHVIGTSGSV